jgi:hypothetical protein
MKSRFYPLAALAAFACAYFALPPSATAMPQAQVVQDDDWCDDDHNDDDSERYCEVREATLSADRSVIDVDASPNGGVHVEGWDRNEILVRAKIVARARSESDAREIAGEVELDLGNRIHAEGPRTGRNEGWWVSYRVYVPHRSNLRLESLNGGISISDVSGEIDFRTTNGGVVLDALAGDVTGSTTNGGLKVELAGDGWDGDGMDVRTTNGGVRISIPDGYNAELESGTVNGGFRIEFPITVQGRIDRRINAVLGDGGKKIRVHTTNGGVVVERA